MDTTPHFPIYMDYSATNPCDDPGLHIYLPKAAADLMEIAQAATNSVAGA